MVTELELLTQEDLAEHTQAAVHNHAQPVAVQNSGEGTTVGLTLNMGANLSVTSTDSTVTIDASDGGTVTGQTLSEITTVPISVSSTQSTPQLVTISDYDRLAAVTTTISEPSSLPFSVETEIGVTDTDGQLQDCVFVSVPDRHSGDATVDVTMYELVNA